MPFVPRNVHRHIDDLRGEMLTANGALERLTATRSFRHDSSRHFARSLCRRFRIAAGDGSARRGLPMRDKVAGPRDKVAVDSGEFVTLGKIP